jgi:hypothetical protein
LRDLALFAHFQWHTHPKRKITVRVRIGY